MKQFLPFAEPCPGCDGHVVILSDSKRLYLDAEHAEVGESVLCTRAGCFCSGIIVTDGTNHAVDWGPSLCKPCTDRIQLTPGMQVNLELLAMQIMMRVQGLKNVVITREGN